MPPYDPEKHHRRSIRLPDYDYSDAGAYFITLCARNHGCLFGTVENGAVRLTALGEIVRDEWLKTPAIRPRVFPDLFVVMPNHFHAIFFLAPGLKDHARKCRPHPILVKYGHLRPKGPKRGSVGAIVGQLKGAISRAARKAGVAPVGSLWQRDLYEHVIRNDRDLDARRHYVQNNPTRWTEDEYYRKGIEGV